MGYVKTADGHEVDFLARFPARGSQLLQVCADLSDPATLERELRSLADAARVHRRATARLLVLDRGPLPGAESTGVEVQAVYEWLFAPPDEA